MKSSEYFSRRSFLKATAASGLAVCAGGARAQDAPPPAPAGTIASTTYPETSASLRIADPSRFRVLQLTDAHFFQKREEIPNANERTVEDWRRMVDLYQPDLVAMTGDLWPDNPEGRGAEFQAAGTTWLGELGVPWVFTWGNHDLLDDVTLGHDVFHDAKHSLYRGGPLAGNYTVSIQNKDGAGVWELLCFNTHRQGLVGHSYDWLKSLAAERAQAPAAAVPSIALFHIPLQQYATLRENKATSGFAFEKVCNEGETGVALKELAALGTVRACFCGHDHVNDYSGTAEGIELVYGRSSGWSAYGFSTVRKGGKLISINAETGNYAWESVFPDGLRWRPNAGEWLEDQIDAPWLKPPVLPAA